jgi:CO dehydrogenase maturation factor
VPAEEAAVKIAVSGKGGVGKSTVAAALALLLAARGDRVLAVDADPDSNLASALGIPAAARSSIVPIAQRKALIEERTGAKVKQYGQIFKMNPDVSDLAAACGYLHAGVGLLVLGAVEAGGSGCACPESVLLKALVMDLVLYKGDTLILDMEAGIEHLGRATARGVDTMLVVVEPGQRSVDCAERIVDMSRQIGLRDVRAVASKVRSAEDEAFLRAALGGIPLVGSIPFSEGIYAADRDGKSVLDGAEPAVVDRFRQVLAALEA